jgi:uncharacterized membrane protein
MSTCVWWRCVRFHEKYGICHIQFVGQLTSRGEDSTSLSSTFFRNNKVYGYQKKQAFYVGFKVINLTYRCTVFCHKGKFIFLKCTLNAVLYCITGLGFEKCIRY